MDKITNVKAIEFVMENCKDSLPTEIVEKLVKIRDQFAKKSTSEKKPTPTQMENVLFKEAILDFLTENDSQFTVSEIIKSCEAVADLTNQRVSALLRQMVADNLVERIVDKRKTYFKAI